MERKPVTQTANDLEILSPLYRSMLRIRLIEEAIAERYSEEKMRCPVHLSIGQEAVPVGVSAALGPEDQAVSTHRCHAHYLAKGGDLDAMLGELHGKATGCCGGRGGSMHLFDLDAGLLVSLPIVASSIPIGVGAALGYRQRGEDRVVVIYLGDASTEEGVFHESANFAALKKLPVIFLCENNLYSVYTGLADRQPERPLEALAVAHGMPAERVDGNDVLAVRRATERAANRARAGGGPTMIVADTYRWREHCGPNYDNDIGYRTPAEFEAWKERDPIAVSRESLKAAGLLVDEAALTDELEAEIAAAFQRAEAAPFPDPATVREDVYA